MTRGSSSDVRIIHEEERNENEDEAYRGPSDSEGGEKLPSPSKTLSYLTV